MQLYLVCGSRDFTNETAIRERLRYLPVNTRVMHGDAPGADRLAARLAEERGLATIAIPADWDRWGRRAGPIRNEQMLSYKPDSVIAFKSRPPHGCRRYPSVWGETPTPPRILPDGLLMEPSFREPGRGPGQPPVDRVATTPAPHAWRRTGHRRPAGVPPFSRLPAAGSSTTPAPPTTPN